MLNDSKVAFKRLENILFLDIETVSCCEDFETLHERLKPLWIKKSLYINTQNEDDQTLFFNRAAIYAEFGKIVTIGIGIFNLNSAGELCLRVKDISSHNEAELLSEFITLITDKFDQKRLSLCAHNGREFDFPYLCRRILVNGLKLPEVLDIYGKKPWEITHQDTMDMWKFGDKKSFTSLELMAALFGIKSSKDGIDGSMVNTVYYREKDLTRIAKYCKEDVAVTAQLYCKLKNLAGPKEENILYV